MSARCAAFGWLLLAALGGCEDKPAASKAPSDPPSGGTTAQSPPPKPPPDPLAGLVVDELGLYLQTHRIDMGAKDADSKLKAAIAGLPVKQKAVPISAARNAKTQHVGALARALGDAGASEINVKTPDRTGADVVLKLQPEQIAGGQVPDCAVVAMIKKDNTSAVWRLKGGTATKFLKGLAGPDMSMTYDGMKDQMGSCSSAHWLLAGEENVIWGLVFDLGQIVAKADPPPKATHAVLVYEAPVAGRAVQLARTKTALPLPP
jgi:hypothetical protein